MDANVTSFPFGSQACIIFQPFVQVLVGHIGAIICCSKGSRGSIYIASTLRTIHGTFHYGFPILGEFPLHKTHMQWWPLI